ncbi:MAG TPA: response regulator transcription factor [Solirubrobacteraceae bacterium]
MIRLLLADDHAVVRDGLRQLLANVDDLEVVATAADGEEAVALAAEHEPDVVLMDLEMPRLDGSEATRRIVAARAETRVVVLTSFSDRERILDALDAGAVGYLLKDADPDELVRGVRAAARGESPLAPRAATAVLQARATRRPEPELTQREREVLDLVGEGLPNKLIARRLGISEKTVKAHVTRIFQAIGVTDRTQAALWVARRRERS